MRARTIGIIGLGLLLCSSAVFAKGADKSTQVADKSDSAKKGASPKIEAGTQMLLVFPSAPKNIPFSEKELSLFRGSLSETDRLGIMVADRKEHLLTLEAKQQKEVTSAHIIASFQKAIAAEDEQGEQAVSGATVESALRSAVAQVSDLDGMVKAVVLVLDSPIAFSASQESSDTTADSAEPRNADADVGSENNTLLSLLTLNNVILYTLYSQDVVSKEVEQLSTQSGGKNFFLSSRTKLNDALYTVYDSVLLRTIQLAPQQALYDSDEVCPEVAPPTAVVAPEGSIGGPQWPLWTFLGVLLLMVTALLALTVMQWKRLGQSSTTSGEKTDKKETNEKQAASFSKLTIGLNRVRNSFAETESKLHALSADLDDFGSDNWELQKKIISAYAEMAREIFLLYDHVLLKADGELSDGEQVLKRKIEQLLEDAQVEELTPQAGTKFHSKYHSHAGERYSEQKAGTILEVVRNGYQRKGFISDEPFVIRQAEVIVSAGQEQGENK